MCPMTVVMIDERRKGSLEMWAADNPQPIQGLGPDRPNKASRFRSPLAVESASVGPPFRHEMPVPPQQRGWRDEKQRPLTPVDEPDDAKAPAHGVAARSQAPFE